MKIGSGDCLTLDRKAKSIYGKNWWNLRKRETMT